MRTIIYLECNKKFEDYHLNRKYCSHRCKLDYKQRKRNKRIKGE